MTPLHTPEPDPEELIRCHHLLCAGFEAGGFDEVVEEECDCTPTVMTRNAYEAIRKATEAMK